MNIGKAFEIFVKTILLNVGFSEITSDGLYVFDGAPGQMIQGLGQAHNADVLLDPPVQTPFYSRTRLLIECKDYANQKVGLNVLRSVLGLREDINNFNIVDVSMLEERRRQNRNPVMQRAERFSYQVGVASMKGFTVPAQEFAAAYRIPLLEFDKMPFWGEFSQILYRMSRRYSYGPDYQADDAPANEEMVHHFAETIGQRMAVAITDLGQMLFLYSVSDEPIHFEDDYSLYWSTSNEPWVLRSGARDYLFQMPKNIMKLWVENASGDLELKREAINCKSAYFSNMIVYYSEFSRPIVKMISINKYELEEAKRRLE